MAESPGVRFVEYGHCTYMLSQDEFYDVMLLKSTLGVTEALAVASVLTAEPESIEERAKFVANDQMDFPWWDPEARWDLEER